MGKSFNILRMLITTCCILILFSFSVWMFSLPSILVPLSWLAFLIINFLFFEYSVWKDKRKGERIEKIKVQIDVLKYVIDNLEELKVCSHYSLCWSIREGLYELLIDELTNPIKFSDIENYIPSFTRENCFKLSLKYGFEMGNSTSAYWWAARDSINRIACLNALIKELEDNC